MFKEDESLTNWVTACSFDIESKKFILDTNQNKVSRNSLLIKGVQIRSIIEFKENYFIASAFC